MQSINNNVHEVSAIISLCVCIYLRRFACTYTFINVHELAYMYTVYII